MAPVQVRPAHLDDRPAILELVRDAFAHDGRDGAEEVEIVEQTWARGLDGVIDLVAAQDEQIVGTSSGRRGLWTTEDCLPSRRWPCCRATRGEASGRS